MIKIASYVFRLVCIGLLGATVSWAQAPGSGNRPAGGSTGSKAPVFLHTPPRPQELPYPGQSFTLYAYLSNTRDTRATVRALVVRDGKFLEIAARPGYLDRNDRPTYEVPLQAPVGEMSYQFFVAQPGGHVTSSARYALRRSCIPQVDLGEGEVPKEVQGVERLRKLVAESKALDNDLSGYNQVLKLLGELKGVVGE